jgi:phenylacetate-CoA ligase
MLTANSYSWPPVYDDDYLPPPGQRYWAPQRETMASEEREAYIVERLRSVMAYAYEHAPFFQQKWDEAGIHHSMIRSLADFQKVPIVTKQDIREEQAKNPPFGSYLCIPPAEIARIHGTSGTTGKPTVFAIGKDDWKRIGNAHARIMWGMGIRPTDTIFFGSFFSLYLGGWGALVGGDRLGATCFPFGAGVEGQTLMAIRWIAEMKPSVFYGTPSYALRIAQVARENGVDPARDFAFRIMFFSGEPGAGIPATKKLIEESFNCRCIDSGSMAEMTPWMTNAECELRTGMHLWQDIVYTELVDPTTGQVVDYGKEGTPVYTHLERNSQPLIRYQSGDLGRWTNDPCECGRTYPRLPLGLYGRIDDMFIVRGENIYPSAIEDVLRKTPGFGSEYRIIISRAEAMDELAVQAEYDERVAAEANADPSRLTGLQHEIEVRLRSVIGVRARVRLLPPNSLDRTEFKSRRVIDQRDLYRSLLVE